MKKLIRLREKDIHTIVKKVIKEQEEISVQERGMKNPTEGIFVIKKWKKRDGEIIRKVFIEYNESRSGGPGGQTTTKKYLPLCETMVGEGHEIVFDNIFIPPQPTTIGKWSLNKMNVTPYHIGDPREECVELSDINYVSKSQYKPPTPPETEDKWWENEITDREEENAKDETESTDIESIKLKVRKYLEKQDSSFAQMMNPTPKVHLQDNTITFHFYNKEGERDKILGVVTDKEGNIINGFESK